MRTSRDYASIISSGAHLKTTVSKASVVQRREDRVGEPGHDALQTKKRRRLHGGHRGSIGMIRGISLASMSA